MMDFGNRLFVARFLTSEQPFIQVKVLCFATPVSFLSSTQRENNPLNPLLHYPFVLARVTQQDCPVRNGGQGNTPSQCLRFNSFRKHCSLTCVVKSLPSVRLELHSFESHQRSCECSSRRTWSGLKLQLVPPLSDKIPPRPPIDAIHTYLGTLTATFIVESYPPPK